MATLGVIADDLTGAQVRGAADGRGVDERRGVGDHRGIDRIQRPRGRFQAVFVGQRGGDDATEQTRRQQAYREGHRTPLRKPPVRYSSRTSKPVGQTRSTECFPVVTR